MTDKPTPDAWPPPPDTRPRIQRAREAIGSAILKATPATQATLPERDDLDLPMLLSAVAPRVGFSAKTLQSYIARKDKRDLFLLDRLFFRIGNRWFSSERRIREWGRALEQRYTAATTPRKRAAARKAAE